MIKEEVLAEIEKLEAELKQLIANANVINGAMNAYHKVLAAIHVKENKVVADAATKVELEAAKVAKNDGETPNGATNP